MAVVFCCGCGSNTNAVTGTVKLAGKPLEKGTISFQPADGDGPTAAEKIVNGQYAVRVRPGQYKVQILGYRKTGERHVNPGDPNSPMTDTLEQIVPERDNTATTLTCDVRRGNQEADFPLEEK